MSNVYKRCVRHVECKREMYSICARHQGLVCGGEAETVSTHRLLGICWAGNLGHTAPRLETAMYSDSCRYIHSNGLEQVRTCIHIHSPVPFLESVIFCSVFGYVPEDFEVTEPAESWRRMKPTDHKSNRDCIFPQDSPERE